MITARERLEMALADIKIDESTRKNKWRVERKPKAAAAPEKAKSPEGHSQSFWDKQCEGCIYRNKSYAMHYCDYFARTGRLRERDKDTCKSRRERGK